MSDDFLTQLVDIQLQVMNCPFSSVFCLFEYEVNLSIVFKCRFEFFAILTILMFEFNHFRAVNF